MPPLNWCGYCWRRRSGSEMPTMPSSSRARARLRGRHTKVDLRRLGQLAPHREDGVERGHRLLENHADLPAADVTHLGVGKAQQVAALEEDLTAHDATGRRRDEAH